MTREDKRNNENLRKIKMTRGYSKYAEGSCLIEWGDTRIVCTATVEETVPGFLKNTGTGWVTAEYGMLPRSCETRIMRDKLSGRRFEIQRLIGRSLRSVINMQKLGERTVKIDCDVLQADGGTRTASITGGFVALAEAIVNQKKKSIIPQLPLTGYVAAVSVGILKDEVLLDLAFREDSKADTDMNVVMLENGSFIEVQGTAEGVAFTKKQMDQMLDCAKKGITQIIKLQKEALGGLDL